MNAHVIHNIHLDCDNIFGNLVLILILFLYNNSLSTACQLQIILQKEEKRNTSFDKNVEIKTCGRLANLYIILVRNQDHRYLYVINLLIIVSWVILYDIFMVTRIFYFLLITYATTTYYLIISPVQPCLVIHLFQFSKSCMI